MVVFLFFYHPYQRVVYHDKVEEDGEMLPNKNQFNNDDALANLEDLEALNTVGSALLLTLGNLAGIVTFMYARWIGSFFLAYSILLSVIVSFFYHLCQTTHECFQLPLTTWVSSDHFTATSMMGLLLLTLINVRTVCQLIHKRRIIRTVPQSNTTDAPIKRSACAVIERIACEPLYKRLAEEELDLCECGQEMSDHFGHTQIEENLIYDEWTSASVVAIYVITAVAVYAHPFSYAAFNIVIASCVIAGFFYILLINEGEPKNFVGRISWPELLISIILSLIGLIAYVLDSYVEYMWLHSLWHVAIYLGIMFLLAGTMKSVNGWFPLVTCSCCCSQSCE